MRILIVDDDRDSVSFLKRGFEAESFEVDVAFDGEAGSAAAKSNAYDLIILDNVMPKKLGLEVCAEARAAGVLSPIMMLSVRTEVPEKVTLLNAGVDDYVTKLYSFEEVLARAHALVRGRGRSRRKALEIGDLRIDPAARTASVAGEDVYLTRKEFLLLELLAENRGTVVSRGAIMERVWDDSADLFSRAIETHILHLRRKLEGPRRRFITTVPGSGYRID